MMENKGGDGKKAKFKRGLVWEVKKFHETLNTDSG